MLSSYTLVAISIDRFLAIMFPLRPNMRLTHQRAIIVIAFVRVHLRSTISPILLGVANLHNHLNTRAHRATT